MDRFVEVFGCLLVFRHGAEAAVADTTCGANGNECANIANSFCDVTNSVCKCVDIATEDAATNTCPLTACPNGASDCSADTNSECSATTTTCTCKAAYHLDGADDANLCVGKHCTSTLTAGCIELDPNSECVSNACACKANYALSLKGTSGLCQPGVGATCTASGSECQHLLGGYCDTTATPVCACADIMPASGDVCVSTSCTADSDCTADTNSECIKDMCVCKSGYALDGTSKSRQQCDHGIDRCHADEPASQCSAALKCYTVSFSGVQNMDNVYGLGITLVMDYLWTHFSNRYMCIS
ncbi:hypothetical protein MAR_008684 [Mya arenaria]|uniref:Uncharacterized protein n=1 Tax=Mya arenaria TaxID=6604 RepID=A0ABY7E4Q4_MYAAR|nr:hypothetical protein MAR_008684 [Mya arenaria]